MHAEVELEEVVHEAQRVVRVQERLADALLVRVGRDDRELGEHPDRVQLDVLAVVRIGLVLVIGRERRDRGGEHRHRVRVVGQRLEEVLEILVQQRVAADLLVELGQLGGRGKLAVDEQPGDLEVAAGVRDLLDRIPAVAQDPLVSVDERDRRLRRRRVHEP